MKLIPLTQGKFAKVDDEDFTELSQYEWFINNGYACRRVTREKGKVIYMHRQISGYQDETDHINRDRLDNQKINLRQCNRFQNMANKGTHPLNTSGYKGVDRSQNKWRASIKFQNKKIFLGRYDDIENAARAYDEAAIKYFGEFAVLNFG